MNLLEDNSIANETIEHAIAEEGLEIINMLEKDEISLRDAEKRLFNGRYVRQAVEDRGCSNLCRVLIVYGMQIEDFLEPPEGFLRDDEVEEWQKKNVPEYYEDIRLICRMMLDKESLLRQYPIIPEEKYAEMIKFFKETDILSFISNPELSVDTIERGTLEANLAVLHLLEAAQITLEEAMEKLYNKDIRLALKSRGCRKACQKIIFLGTDLQSFAEYNPDDMQDGYDRIKLYIYKLFFNADA
jgi:Fe-S cluster assembly iron-binding protein IscA